MFIFAECVKNICCNFIFSRCQTRPRENCSFKRSIIFFKHIRTSQLLRTTYKFITLYTKIFSQNSFVESIIKKNEKLIWTKDQYLAFENLKKELTDESMLAFYDNNKKYILVTDACNESIGGILLQVNNNNEENL